MSIENQLKDDAEKLVRIAIDQRVAVTQLRKLLEIVNTRTLPEIEVYVKYQMGREEKGKGIPWNFGIELLSMIKKYEFNKQHFFKMLQYTTMLYGYEERVRQGSIRNKIEPVVLELVRSYGYKGLDVTPSGREIQLKVYLENFSGNPKELSERIASEIRSKMREFSGNNIRIWIERVGGDRR